MDSSFLNAAGRKVRLPFTVTVEDQGSRFTVTADRLLRVIPGKRLVCSGVWEEEGRRIVVKFFLKSRRIRRHFRREKEGTRALAASGVRTPEIVFQGTVGPGNVKVLAFREIVPASDMKTVWRQQADTAGHSDLVKKMIREIASLHEAGLKQDDLHLGNFIISRENIFTIDGDAVDTRDMGSPLPEEKSMDNLAVFFSQFDIELDSTVGDSLHFYEDCRRWNREKDRLSRLFRKIKKHRGLRRDQYLRKVFRDSTAHILQKSWSRQWVCDRNAYAGGLDQFIEDPDAFIRNGRILKDGNTATVARIDIGDTAYAVKRYNIKNVRHFFRRFVRKTRARISWRNAHLLTFLGVKTPRPVMFMEERQGPVRLRAFFVTEYVKGPDVLHLLQEDPGGRVIDPAVLSEKFAALFRRLIDVRLSHGDFKATNFILEDGEICLIDLDSMKSHRVNALFKKAFRRDLRRFQKNWESLPEISQTMDKAAREGGSLLNSGRIHEKNDELKIQNEKV